MIRDGRYKLMWGDPASDARKLGRLHLDKPVDVPPSPPRLYDLAGDGAGRHLLLEMIERLLVRTDQDAQTQPFKSRGVYRPL